ncbi:hypothetical protein C7378_2112 [Acidipila rosea]|uniref:Uncharacterized protein n=2 Tax=Acidipila rosea TaxID=768535 RepID=A0A4R1L649_9BACT|nr:hypothetical protein C7378_2112 [Acidipila rosea]
MGLLCNRASLSPVQRRHYSLFMGGLWLESLAMIIVSQSRHRLQLTGSEAILLAMLPALPIFYLIFVVARYLIQEKDEFIRSLIMQAMLCGIGLTLAVDTTWGYLTEIHGTSPLPQFANFVLFFVTGALAWRIQLARSR